MTDTQLADSKDPPHDPAAPRAEAPKEPVTTATSAPDTPLDAKDPAEPPKPAPEPPKRNYEAERKQERIDKLTAQLRAREAELAATRAANPDAAKVQEEINTRAKALATEEAKKIAEWNAFLGAVNAASAEGKKEFGEEKFTRAETALAGLNPRDNAEGQAKYFEFVQAVLDTGAGPKLILALGEDTNEAARILGLPAAKMGMELGKLASRDIEDVSVAPKPITPISGVGRNHVAIAAEDTERSDGLDMRVWMERRNAHVAQVNQRAGRRIIP